jgi:hypothetical protein
VKLIVGILGSDTPCLTRAVEDLASQFGAVDLASEIWPFTYTRYYENEMGSTLLRQFISFADLVDPGELARIKHQTNRLEQEMARTLHPSIARPVNLDPGLVETSKLILASTKNFSHRVYIGDRMYAEVTLSFQKGSWVAYPYTFPDYRQPTYHGFLSSVRERLRDQWREGGPAQG